MVELLLPPHVHCPRCGRENHPRAICAWCHTLMAASNAEISGVPGTSVEPTAVEEPPEPALAEAPRAPAMPPSSPKATAAAARTAKAPPRRPFRPMDLWRRHLPPVRLVWISLVAITAYGGGFVSATRAVPFLALLFAGVAADLGFQRVRFPTLRFPDAALATTMFLVLIIWPAGVSIALTSVAVAAVGLRHIARSGGHPWFNPAAAGLTIAVLVFGLPTSWHIGVNLSESVLVLALGLLVLARAPRTWRLPAFFFASYVPVMIVLSVLTGGRGILAGLLTTGALSAAPLFYGLFMVTEPRTAPSSGRAMPVFAVAVGVAAAVLPILFNELPLVSALGIVAPFFALFAGNALTVLLPSARGRQAAASPAAAHPPPVPASRRVAVARPPIRPSRPVASPVGRSPQSAQH